MTTLFALFLACAPTTSPSGLEPMEEDGSFRLVNPLVRVEPSDFMPDGGDLLSGLEDNTMSVFRASSTVPGLDVELTDFAVLNCVTSVSDWDNDCDDEGEAPGSDHAIAGAVTVWYYDSDGNVVMSESLFVEGLAYFAGEDFFVSSDPDDLALLVVAATAALEVDEVNPIIQFNFAGTYAEGISVDDGRSVRAKRVTPFVAGATWDWIAE